MISFLKRLCDNVRNNYKEVIFAVLLSIGLWFFVTIQIFPTIENRIENITVDSVPTASMAESGLQIIGDTVSSVDIKISGKRYIIGTLEPMDFYATLDLSSIHSAGEYTVPVNVITRSDSSEISVTDVSPSVVTIQIDKIVSKEFELNATAPDISLVDGYYLDTLVASPDTITVTGSESIINSIFSVEARSTYSGQIGESHETKGELIFYNKSGSKIANPDVTIDNENITVNIPVYKQKELPLTITITNYPSNFDLSSLKYEIIPSTINISCSNDSIDFLSEINIGTIDITDIKLEQSNRIPISLPEEYKNLSGNSSAQIVWDTSSYGKLDFNVDNINIINKQDNFDVYLVTNVIGVSVIGPSDIVSAMVDSDIHATVNLMGVSLVDGMQEVPVTFAIRGANQKCWVSGSYKATINAVSKEENQ